MTLNQQREQLCADLQAAIELELATLPPYLTAYFSIKEHTNIEAAKLLRSVFMEEMLHLCLAGNVLVAIGGEVRLGRANVPSYPCTLQFHDSGVRDREFEIKLQRFSPDAIETFRRIELPEKFPPVTVGLGSAEDMMLSAYSIGEFYERISASLADLDQAYRDEGASLFNGDTSRQITETYFWSGGGKPIAVTDLASARHALNIIVEQGEASTGSLYDGDEVEFGQSEDMAHYFKFTEIQHQQRYVKDGDPRQPPQGEPLEVDYHAVYPIKTSPSSADYDDNPDLAALNQKFNRSYSLMLRQIEEAYGGNPRVLYNAVMDGMHDLSPIARTMARISIVPGGGETGTPTYEWVEPLA